MNFNLGHINKIASVSVILTGDGYYFDLVLVKNKKDGIEILKKVKHLNSVEELLKHAGKYVSFILHFSGKGILNKQVENTPNYRSKMLFDTNLDDFYFTDVQSNDFVYSSMIRKDVVENIVELFNTKLNHIISITTGPFIVAELNTFINQSEICVYNYVLKFNHTTLVDYNKSEERLVKNYSIGDNLISNSEISAVAHAYLFFYGSENVTLPEDNAIFKVARKETEAKNVFIRFGAAMLIFFLVILMGNMIYLDQLNKTINENYAKLSTSEQALKQIGLLKDEKLRKEKMLNSSGVLNRQFLSFYLMEISNSAPNEIALTEISIRPVFSEIKQHLKIEIENNNIYILGETPSSNLLSQWIKRLEKKDWVNKIDILNYYYTKGKGEFELKIEMINV
ncbi:MAG: hypothetical protein ACWA41_10970 [Putridiphycobacter sp.]